MNKPYTLSEDDKATPVMVYTQNEMIWGDVVTPKAIRIGIWFRTDMAPGIVNVYAAHSLSLWNDGPERPAAYNHIAIPIGLVTAFHPMPNVKEQLFYDPQEPNRKMETVIATVGLLQVRGYLRLATTSTLRQFMDVNRDVFTSLYDIEVSHHRMPQGRTFHLAHGLVRTSATIFAQ
ncbi:MAG: hypothetical protein KJ063_11465 [Anaerolineae bacterium]|nr:hypothetical protein [Anaerolineae bacterium]